MSLFDSPSHSLSLSPSLVSVFHSSSLSFMIVLLTNLLSHPWSLSLRSLSQSLFFFTRCLSVSHSLSLFSLTRYRSHSFTYYRPPSDSLSYSFAVTHAWSRLLTAPLSLVVSLIRSLSYPPSLSHTAHSLLLVASPPQAISLSHTLPPSHALSLSRGGCLSNFAIGPNECWPLRSTLNATGSGEY